MTDTSTKAVEDLIAEIEGAFTCRCETGYTDRRLHAPDCQGYMLPGTTDTLRALLAEREALREFYDAAVADGAEDVPGAPDEESIGWVGDRDMVMTYGHIRRAAPAAKGEGA